VNSGHFPKPVVLGPETDKNSPTRWLRTEIDEWIKTRPREKLDG
jgi:predicted DNA-binding transcriptional regulator AlpA